MYAAYITKRWGHVFKTPLLSACKKSLKLILTPNKPFLPVPANTCLVAVDILTQWQRRRGHPAPHFSEGMRTGSWKRTQPSMGYSIWIYNSQQKQYQRAGEGSAPSGWKHSKAELWTGSPPGPLAPHGLSGAG